MHTSIVLLYNARIGQLDERGYDFGPRRTRDEPGWYARRCAAAALPAAGGRGRVGGIGRAAWRSGNVPARNAGIRGFESSRRLPGAIVKTTRLVRPGRWWRAAGAAGTLPASSSVPDRRPHARSGRSWCLVGRASDAREVAMDVSVCPAATVRAPVATCPGREVGPWGFTRLSQRRDGGHPGWGWRARCQS
jgi:hypothetical protein